MQQRVRFLFVFVFALFAIGISYSQTLPSSWLIDRCDISNGLAYNDVTCFFQDKKGFMWIGTKHGLSRFDGRKFKNYESERGNPTSLPHSHVLSISQITDGRLAIGTEQGFAFLNMERDLFESYSPGSDTANHFTSGYYSRIFQDSKKRIWIFSLDGLYQFNPENMVFTKFQNPIQHPDHGIRLGNQIYALVEDQEERFWIGTGDGLFQFFPEKNEWQRAFQPRQNAQYHRFGMLIAGIFPHPAGGIMFSSYDYGLHRLDRENRTETIIDSTLPAPQIRYSHIHDYPLLCWKVTGNTLSVANSDDLKFKTVTNKSEKSESKSWSINAIYTDKDQRLWLAFPGKGFGWMSPEKQINHTFSATENGLPLGSISTILEDGNRLWVGNYHGNDLSLWQKEPLKLIKTWFPLPGTSKEDNHANVGHILKTSDGVYWFSTLSGLYRYEEKVDGWSHFQPKFTDKLQLFNQRRFVKAQPDGTTGLWLQRYGSGLAHFDFKTQDFEFYGSEKEGRRSLPVKQVSDITTDPSGNLWMAGNGKLYKRKVGQTEFQLAYSKPDIKGMSQIEFSKSGAIWVATDAGLLTKTGDNQSFRLISFTGRFPVEVLESISIDGQNRIWASHIKGITLYDPSNDQSCQFTTSNGLPVAHIPGILAGANHRIWYFLEQTLGWLDVENMECKLETFPVHITSVAYQSKSLWWKEIEGGTQIEIPFDQNDLEVEFSVLNFVNPLETKYFYRIEGQSSGWTKVQDGKIHFSNLAPGRYQLMVSGSNTERPGLQSSMILIIVQPPFWETWWFRIGLILLFVVLIYLFVNQRIKKIEKDAEIKARIEKEISDLQMKALRTQMNPHFLFNSFNAIQECIMMGKTQEAVLYLAKFAKLVRMILEHSDKSLISLSQEIDVLRNYLDVESLRFSDPFETDIQIHTHLDPNLLQIPPMLVQPIVENAIWHGLSKKEGLKKLLIRFESTEDYLLISVEDNGIGRQKSAGNRKSSHRSLAMGIIEDRFKLLGNEHPHELLIEDLLDENGTATGTRVTMKLGVYM